MKTIYCIIICFACCIALPFVCQAGPDDEFIETKNISVVCKYRAQQSHIFGTEAMKDSCSKQSETYYVIKDRIFFDVAMEKPLVIKTWSELKRIKSKYIESPLLEKINPKDFSKYHYAIVLISFTGNQYATNERLYEQNACLIFSYDIRDMSGPRPLCAWIDLYVMKLKK
jgi:hypothetical protein